MPKRFCISLPRNTNPPHREPHGRRDFLGKEKQTRREKKYPLRIPLGQWVSKSGEAAPLEPIGMAHRLSDSKNFAPQRGNSAHRLLSVYLRLHSQWHQTVGISLNRQEAQFDNTLEEAPSAEPEPPFQEHSSPSDVFMGKP